MVKGVVESISQQNNAVQIDGTWYSLQPHVKLSYVKKGAVEYTIEKTPEGQNDEITFIKSVENSSPKPTNSSFKDGLAVDENQLRMSALKYAGNIYMGTGQEEEAKILTEKAIKFLREGSW